VWDSLGNLQMHGDDHGDGQGVATSDTYRYDELNRLVHYSVNGRNVINRQVQLKYNALGNILVRTDVGAYVYPAAGQPRPHAVQFVRGSAYGTGYSADFSYDAQGNMVGATGNPKYRTLRYNSFNLPQGAGSLPALEGTPDAQGRRSTYDWAYDEDEQRIRETKVSVRGTRVTWYLHPDGAGGLGYEQEQDEAGQVNHRHFIGAGSATAMVLMQGATPTAIAKTEYWHKDHLGSTVALTVASSDGAALARIVRYAYDPFGKRRYESGAYDATGALIADYSGGSPVADAGTDRGFTGHEHLDDVGIIHMNGRTYDPLIARFMQADPVVGDPFDLQTYNGYSYVYNRPLNTVDPDGRCPWCVWAAVGLVAARATGIIDQNTFRQLLGITVAAWLGPGGYTLLADTAANAALNVAISGFASGVISSGNLKGGLQGMFSSLVFYGAGIAADAQGFTEGGAGRALMHAAAGCVTSVAGGGKCGRGAFTAGASHLVGGKLANGNDLHDTLIHGAIGGTASVLGGGKFSNGAVTGAFGYIYNSRFHAFMVGIRAHQTWNAYIRTTYGPQGYVADRASAALDFDTINFNGRPDTVAPGEGSSQIWELKSQRCLADAACRLSAEIQIRRYQASASLKSDGSSHMVMLGDAHGVGLQNGPITQVSPNGAWEFSFKYDGDGLVGYKGTRIKQNGNGGGGGNPIPIPIPPPCDCNRKDKDAPFGPLSPSY
jgi:RHS repeat-associated protein